MGPLARGRSPPRIPLVSRHSDRCPRRRVQAGQRHRIPGAKWEAFSSPSAPALSTLVASPAICALGTHAEWLSQGFCPRP